MKIWIYLFFSIICVSCFSETNHLRELKNVEAETVKTLESKYKMRACGSGGGTMYGINTAMLAFSIDRPVTLEEARKILVGSTEIYLENINNNKKIRPYLEEYPFSPERLDLEFYVDPSHKKVDNSIRYFTLFCGGNIKVPTVTYDINNGKKIKETYEETKEHMNESNQ